MDESREFYVELGRRMAALRAAQGLSQAELAQALGLKQTTYSGYESGRWTSCRRSAARSGPRPGRC